MNVERLILGAYQTNCHILRENRTARDCVIVDTGLEAEGLIDFLAANNLNPKVLILTHGHIDHIAGVEMVRENYPEVKVYIHRLDAGMLTEPQSNLSLMEAEGLTTGPAEFFLEESDVIEHSGIKLKVLHTPGHTPGGICLYAADEKIVFVGDTLFAESVGRTDLPGGDMGRLINGIREKLLILPDETVVYPGHGPATTIGREKAHNPYLQ